MAMKKNVPTVMIPSPPSSTSSSMTPRPNRLRDAPIPMESRPVTQTALVERNSASMPTCHLPSAFAAGVASSAAPMAIAAAKVSASRRWGD
jgi:hypothetical protein